MKFCIFVYPSATRLLCVRIAAHFQLKFIKKSLDPFVILMCGAKRPLYIFSLAVSNAKIVAETFVEELPFVDSHRRQSIAFERHIYQACLTSTRKAVAVREGLSHSTVKDIFNFWAAMKRMSTATYPIRILGIDELSIKSVTGNSYSYSLILIENV